MGKAEDLFWTVVRLMMSFIFLWAFFDKVFGLGFGTAADKSWISGVSPTYGFLQFGAKGVFAAYFHQLAGSMVVDILFMLGLFLVGISLAIGIGIRIACISGCLLLFLMYLAVFPPANNPLVDEHIIYMLVLVGIYTRTFRQSTGFGKYWQRLAFVKKHSILL